MRARLLSWFCAGCMTAGLLFSVQSVFSFEWPIKAPQVVSTFGSPQERSYKKGIEIASEENRVAPIEGGEVILRGNEYAQGTRDIPSPLGNMVVLQHERGIRSVYGHLEAAVDNEVPFYEADDRFGRVGKTGITDEEFILLQIIDSEVNRFINPMLSLPSLADSAEPRLNAVSLQSSSENYQLGPESAVAQGKYDVLIETYDEGSERNSLQRMAPYSIKVYLNGEEQISLGFESLAVKDWKAVPTSQRAVSATELYSGQWTYNLGPLVLQPGVASIEVFVSDYAGNETIETYRLQVTAR